MHINFLYIEAILLTVCIHQFHGILADSEEISFEHQILGKHNDFRRLHGCPDLALESDLYKGCFNHARKLGVIDKLEYSNGNYGENICFRVDDDPVKCVEQWYNESREYDYSKAEYSDGTRHFTQLIWKSSKLMGVAQHRGTSGKIFVVARYMPAGNSAGQFVKNVPRSKFNGSKCPVCNYFLFCSLMLIRKVFCGDG